MNMTFHSKVETNMVGRYDEQWRVGITHAHIQDDRGNVTMGAWNAYLIDEFDNICAQCEFDNRDIALRWADDFARVAIQVWLTEGDRAGTYPLYRVVDKQLNRIS